MTLSKLTAAQAAFLNRLESPLPRASKPWHSVCVPITTAKALLASALDGDDLKEAFDALSLFEQARYLNDPRRKETSLGSPRFYGEYC